MEPHSRWRLNAKAMRDRVSARLCAAHARSHCCAAGGRGKLAVARVFKGNVVLARVARTVKEAFLKKSSGKFSKQPSTIKRDILKENAAFTEASATLKLLRSIAVPVIGNICHVFMHGLNRTEVHELQILQDALLHRPKGQGLVTVSNHVAAMDDPLVTASLLSPHMMLRPSSLRWTLCATDRCFTSPLLSTFFTCLKVLPVSRGEGVHQQGMNMALDRINRGEWVHIFPEGSRSRDGGKTVANAKRGVGRLLSDSINTPLIVPYVHDGMQNVMPVGSSFPHIGNRVTVLVGDPISVDDIIEKFRNGELTDVAVYDAVARRVGQRMQDLKVQLDGLVAQRRLELEEDRRLHAAQRIWERVDWEMQGLSVVEELQNQELSSAPAAVTEMKQERQQQLHSYQEHAFILGSITSRLKAYADRNALLSFAARGAFCNRELRWAA